MCVEGGKDVAGEHESCTYFIRGTTEVIARRKIYIGKGT